MSKHQLKTNLCQRIKYKMIQLPLEKELSDIITNSLKSIDHKPSFSNLKRINKQTCFFQNKSIKYIDNHVTTLGAVPYLHQSKKVGFKTNLIQILQKDIKASQSSKISINHGRAASRKCSISVKKPLRLDSKASKHLTSISCIRSLMGGITQKVIPTSRSKRTARSFEAEFLLQKKQIEQYLLKISIFEQSKFTQKQLIQWLLQYCKKQNIILLNFLLKSSISRRKGKKIEKQWQMERNYDILISKLDQKHADRYLCIKRFLKLTEIRALNSFLQLLYQQKNRVKMKEFEDQIGDNIRKLCQKIRLSENNQFVVESKTRSTQVVNFLGDMRAFEQQYGNLRHISGINRLRFNMINNTDNFIEKQIGQVNDQLKTIIRQNKVTVIQ